LGELLKSACNIGEIGGLTDEIRSKYDYSEIRNKEAAIKAKKDKLVSDYKIKFTEKPIITIDLDNANYGF
jgi:hypothetical protein